MDILNLTEGFLTMSDDQSMKVLHFYKLKEAVKVIGTTGIDCIIDCGFSLYLNKRINYANITIPIIKSTDIDAYKIMSLAIKNKIYDLVTKIKNGHGQFYIKTKKSTIASFEADFEAEFYYTEKDTPQDIICLNDRINTWYSDYINNNK